MADTPDPIDPADLVYEMTVPACGRDWMVPRANKIARRIEKLFGPIMPLAQRLRTVNIVTEDLARLISAMIEDQPHAPDLTTIEAWLFRTGPAKVAPALALEVATLVAGNAAVAEFQRERLGSRQRAPDDPGPFARTAG